MGQKCAQMGSGTADEQSYVKQGTQAVGSKQSLKSEPHSPVWSSQTWLTIRYQLCFAWHLHCMKPLDLPLKMLCASSLTAALSRHTVRFLYMNIHVPSTQH